jgi:hypothetical protein
MERRSRVLPRLAASAIREFGLDFAIEDPRLKSALAAMEGQLRNREALTGSASAGHRRWPVSKRSVPPGHDWKPIKSAENRQF